jgi:hypothetical protein
LLENFDRFNNALYKEKEMADFRKCIIVLATLALLLGTAVTASAQSAPPFVCTSLAVPQQIRAEGITELVGDFILNCTGGTPVAAGAPAPVVNITVSIINPGVQITSRILTAPDQTESLLLVDEPTNVQAKVCNVGTSTCPVNGVAGFSSPYLAAGAYNAWQGQLLAGGNSVVFSGVPIAPPGTAGGVREFRITNIRVDANALGVPAITGTGLQISASITTSNPSTLPITSNTAAQVVATSYKSLIVTVSGATSFQQCFTNSGLAATITFQKAFGSAFRPRVNGVTPTTPTTVLPQDVVAFGYNTESGYYNPLLTTLTTSAGSAGLADTDTELQVIFGAINTGVSVTVPPTIPAAIPTDGSLYAVLVATSTVDTSGTVTPDASGNAVAIYEVLQANVSNPSETLAVPISISYTANPGAGSPALGTSTVDGAYAPTSTVTTASSGPIPRFAYTPNPQPDFTIVKCATHLLFPYVTNVAGFDTGLAIANTSQDPYSTSVQDGTCQLNWYGAGGPWAPTITPSVTNGTTWASTAMLLQPGFNGYVIADCQFQYAHGFAFVTRVGAVDVAMGYLALVIPDYPPRVPNPVSCPPTGVGCGAGSGEQLGE